MRTIAQRKREGAGRRTGAVVAIAARLRRHARAAGGRYWLYGSAARGALRHDSDVDLLVDFPAEAEAEAWRLAEALCAEHGVEGDIRPLAWCEPAFAVRVRPGAIVLE